MMKRAFAAAAFAGTLIAAAAGVASAHPAMAPVCGSMGGTLSRDAQTPSYSLRLVVGPVEEMYTKAEVAKKHPKSGEVVLGGAPMQMVEGSAARHLEVHVCKRGTADVVRNAAPTITVSDLTAHTTRKVPVSMMQGVMAGASDLHYGNNASLPAGHRFRVTVAVKGEQASFTFVAPKVKGSGGMG